MYATETKSIALFDCPHCIDNFAFDYEKIKNLAVGWRVLVRCPGCANLEAAISSDPQADTIVVGEFEIKRIKDFQDVSLYGIGPGGAVNPTVGL